ncbi:MAG: type II toxin-antitoxin system RelE/ParE family toxin [Anaerolineae bacterium]
MRYRTRYSKEADHSLLRVPGNYRQRFRRIISELADDPEPTYSEALRGHPNRRKIKVDGWRLIYQVEPDTQTLWILRIRLKTGPETYEGLDALM